MTSASELLDPPPRFGSMKAARVESANPIDAVSSGNEAFPSGFASLPDGSHEAEPRDGDPAARCHGWAAVS